MIYNSPAKVSMQSMQLCMKKSKPLVAQWNLSPFDGCNPYNIHEYERRWPLKDGKYCSDTVSVKACFYSHFALWVEAAEKNQLTIVLEHDFYAHRKIDENITNGEYDFLHMAIYKGHILTCLSSGAIARYHKNEAGLHPLRYRYHPYYGEPCFPGTHNYAITPHGAEKAIACVAQNGWEFADAFINANFFDTRYVNPDYSLRGAYDVSISFDWEKTKDRVPLTDHVPLARRRSILSVQNIPLLESSILCANNKYLNGREKIIKFLIFMGIPFTHISILILLRKTKRQLKKIKVLHKLVLIVRKMRAGRKDSKPQ